MNKTTITCFLILIVFFIPSFVHSEKVQYELRIEPKSVHFHHKETQSLSINDSIPGPTLTAEEGDTLYIRVYNGMEKETSIHWNGLLVPNFQNGVPYLNTPPIYPGKWHTYEFVLQQSGTYHYRSHTGLQAQQGVYGAIIVHPKKELFKSDRDYILILSDWINESPNEVLRTLKRQNNYYSRKKGTLPTLWAAYKNKTLKSLWKSSLMRIPYTDLSEIGYDTFLINGQEKGLFFQAKPGETVRLRFINASAATYFYVQYSGNSMQIIASDGNPVEPFQQSSPLLIATGETYDILVQIPQNGDHQIQVMAQDGSGSVSATLGFQESQHTLSGSPQLNAHLNNSVYNKLESIEKTSFPLKDSQGNELKWRKITLDLTGNSEHYRWSFNGKTIFEEKPILINKGEYIRLTLNNKTLKNHPIHLQGHFFRVINPFSERSPLKHTVNIAPLSSQTIEFQANKDRNWLLHSQNLYSMRSGMNRIVRYIGSKKNLEVQDALLKKQVSFKRKLRKIAQTQLADGLLKASLLKQTPPWLKDSFYIWADIAFLSNITQGKVQTSNSRHILKADWEINWENEEIDNEQIDATVTYTYYWNRLWQFFGGISPDNQETDGIFGIEYLLPFHLASQWRINTEGVARLTLNKKIFLTQKTTFHGEFEYNTDGHWQGSTAFERHLSKRFSLLVIYHTEYEAGGGLKVYF